jgi:anti-anti-sigma regulatory factor
MNASPQEPGKEALVTGRVDEWKSRLLTEIHGDVTSTNVPRLRREMAAIIENADSALWKSLYVDMRTARLLDCMGLNWIYAETFRLKDLQKNIVIRISSPAINRIMRFAAIEKLATIKFRRRKQTR